MSRVVLVAGLPGATGSVPTAAALAVAAAAGAPRAGQARNRPDAGPASGELGGAVLIEVGGDPRRPTLLASAAARRLEQRLSAAGLRAVSRGRITWVTIGEEGWRDQAETVLDAIDESTPVVLHVAAPGLDAALAGPRLAGSAVMLRADLPRQRSLAALAVAELRAAGSAVRIIGRSPGRVAARRAIAGLEPGGELQRVAERAVTRLCGVAVAPRAMSGDRLAGAGPKPPRGGSGGGTEPFPGQAQSGKPDRTALANERGQALPLALGAAILLVIAALALAAIGGGVAGAARAQRVADLAAVSAARSLRDDLDRRLAPALLADGLPNPAHLSKAGFLERARAAARAAARRNGADPDRIAIRFPDRDSLAPLRVRVRLAAELAAGGRPRDRERGAERDGGRVEVVAVAAATPPSGGVEAAPAYASGGGYSGPLVYRHGEGMRPDVAGAFDRMAAAAARDGIAIAVNSGFRSDAEQAVLFAQNPDPRMVAPPGHSLHRCATELDLGPPSAYGWLAANAGRFGFAQRYSWEPWHYGFVAGPEPCSPAAERQGRAGALDARAGGGGGRAGRSGGRIGGGGRQIGGSGGRAGGGGRRAGRSGGRMGGRRARSGDRRGGDGRAAGAGLPAYVPSRYREMIGRAAARWNVSAGLLAAQLMAESSFDPNAVSPVGAQGIAQFMPGTAAAYGLRDPFDPAAAIDAQAHLMSDLLRQFGDVSLALAAYNAGPGAVASCTCIPPYPETQGYVARILALAGAAGGLAVPPPELEVRLVG